MTERFTIKDSTITDGYCIFDKEKKYHFVPNDNKNALMSTVKTLNELSEENEQLKIRCGDGEQIIRDLKKENERLKQTIADYETIIDKQKHENTELQEAMKRMMIDMMTGRGEPQK